MMQTVIGQFIARTLLDAPTHVIDADDDLLTSGLVDSLGIMSLVFFLEQQYGVQIPPGDVTLEHFGTLRAIERYLQSRNP
jgi:acyl carrier protein